MMSYEGFFLSGWPLPGRTKPAIGEFAARAARIPRCQPHPATRRMASSRWDACFLKLVQLRASPETAVSDSSQAAKSQVAGF